MENSLMLGIGVRPEGVGAVRRSVQSARIIAARRESLGPLVGMGGIIRLVVDRHGALAGGDAHGAQGRER
jgi:hypothetical protein